ncbi:type II toxin-antitoxin system PemK/MazF family toxin [Priestia megaterium]|uniref:type II toxin-antitoxin system PemK/MazF family toxin n=1 Tax=Priestia megaterium TaxID=1404 RepID=UPI003D2791FD
MLELKKGDVVVYSDPDSGKKRPAVIVGEGLTVAELDVTIAKITSQDIRNKYDIRVEHWEEAKLKRPSVVRCSKINTIHSSEIIFKPGKLLESDYEKVRAAILEYLTN